MQRLIAKYGSAVHLACLVVAPLFLFPLVSEGALATVLLWLCVPAASWTLLSPSVLGEETFRDARCRVLRSVARDPLTWVLLVTVALSAIRALNTGIGLSYDAEQSKWYVAAASLPLLPGSVAGAGYLPFAVTTSALVVILSCRHALGSSARMCFLLLSSALGGLAAVIAIFLVGSGNQTLLAMAGTSATVSTFAGEAFAIHLVCGTVALVAAFERKWRLAVVLFVFAIGGTAAGAFVFAPAFAVEVFAAVEVLLVGYTFFYSSGVLRSSGEFKMLVVTGISLTLGGLLVAAFFPESLLREKLTALMALSFYSEDFLALRDVLSDVGRKAWLSHLWIGTGVGSFSMDFRFSATSEDWLLVPGGVVAVTNGWWQILAERGVVGIVALLVPVGLLLFSYFKRLVLWVPERHPPHPVCLGAILAAGGVLTVSFFSCSFLRADLALILLALLVVAARSFPRADRSGNGG